MPRWPLLLALALALLPLASVGATAGPDHVADPSKGTGVQGVLSQPLYAHVSQARSADARVYDAEVGIDTWLASRGTGVCVCPPTTRTTVEVTAWINGHPEAQVEVHPATFEVAWWWRTADVDDRQPHRQVVFVQAQVPHDQGTPHRPYTLTVQAAAQDSEPFLNGHTMAQQFLLNDDQPQIHQRADGGQPGPAPQAAGAGQLAGLAGEAGLLTVAAPAIGALVAAAGVALVSWRRR